jgi:predicted ribosome quality control (RQC) complex YloA/Tae2 family protein
MDMLTNERSLEETAVNWDLPVEAVEEIVRYCEQNRTLLEMEADEEARRLRAGGVEVGS